MMSEQRAVPEMPEVGGTSTCPICGKSEPHQHTGEEIALHRGAVHSLADLQQSIKSATGLLRDLARTYDDKGWDRSADDYMRYAAVLELVPDCVATLTAERDALAATLRQGAESDTDLRTRYEALERENVALKAQVARLSAPVSEKEWDSIWYSTARDFANKLIAARTAPAKETPCPKCGGIEKVQAGDMAIHECDRCYHCWDDTAPAKESEAS